MREATATKISFGTSHQSPRSLALHVDLPPPRLFTYTDPSSPSIGGWSVPDSDFRWRWLATDYDLLIPLSWHGEVLYRGAVESLRPGLALIAAPGEIHEAHRVGVAGMLAVVSIDARHFRRRPVGEGVVQLSDFTFDRLLQMCRTLASSEDERPREIELAQLASAIDTGAPLGAKRCSLSERIKQRLALPLQGRVLINEVFAGLGVDQFRAMRAFKRRYGIPPGAYLMSLRIARARALLRKGQNPARAAADCGFVDQSHLCRHFKRRVGMTPAMYSRAAPRASEDAAVTSWAGAYIDVGKS